MKSPKPFLSQGLPVLFITGILSLSLLAVGLERHPQGPGIWGLVVILWGVGLGWMVISWRRSKAYLELLIRGLEATTRGLKPPTLGPAPNAELKAGAQALQRFLQELDLRLATMARQKHELETILRDMVEGVIVLDAQFIIRRINQTAMGFFPSNRDHQGLSLIDACRNSGLYTLARELLHGPNTQIQGEIQLSDLTTTLSVQGAVLTDEDEKRWGLVLVFRDITPQRKLEIMRKDFVANVSHELRTPLTSIRGFVETLNQGALENPAVAKKFLETIERQSLRMSLIIEDLLQLSRLESGQVPDKVQEADLRSLIEGLLQSLGPKLESKKISVNFQGPNLEFQGFPRLLEQAVSNLLDNAIKFSPAGSLISLNLAQDENFFFLQVMDQGPGISAADKARIFERFYRTDKGRETEGTGLGLSIVKHILALHQGTVEVKDNPEGGSVFTLRIPRHPKFPA